MDSSLELFVTFLPLLPGQNLLQRSLTYFKSNQRNRDVAVAVPWGFEGGERQRAVGGISHTDHMTEAPKEPRLAMNPHLSIEALSDERVAR